MEWHAASAAETGAGGVFGATRGTDQIHAPSLWRGTRFPKKPAVRSLESWKRRVESSGSEAPAFVTEFAIMFSMEVVRAFRLSDG
jgi:hypothetical protein